MSKNPYFFLILSVLVFTLCLSCESTKPEIVNFTINNHTGLAISEGYYKNPGTSNWKLLFSANIPSGGYRVQPINVSAMDTRGYIDIQLRTSIDILFTKLHTIAEKDINFTESDIDPTCQQQVTIKNNTDGYFSYGYARLPGGTEWINIFSDTRIEEGVSQVINIPIYTINEQGKVDLWMAGSHRYIKRNLTIVANETVIFTEQDVDPRPVTVKNNTGVYISSSYSNGGYIRLPGTVQWYSLFNGVSIAEGATHSVTIDSRYIDSQERVDIRLDVNGVWYTKLNQLTTANGNITFLAEDIDADGAQIYIYIHNNTGESSGVCRARVPGTIQWYDLRVGYSNVYIPNGETLPVVISRSHIDSQGKTDIRFIAGYTSPTYTKLNQNIIVNGTITFELSDFDCTNPRPVIIKNETGLNTYLQIRRPGTEQWGNTWLSNIEDGGERSFTIQIINLDEQDRVDLQLIETSGHGVGYSAFFTKLYQPITVNDIITFTPEDLDAESYPPIYIKNDTEQVISQVSIRQPSATQWSTWYSGLSWVTGETRLFVIRELVNEVDLRLSTSTSVFFTRLNEPIIAYSTVTFDTADKDPASFTQMTISNDTGLTISNASVGTNWTNLFTGATLADGESRLVGIPLISTGRADFSLWGDGVYFVKNEQPITENGNVTFVASDISPKAVTLHNYTGFTITSGQIRRSSTLGWSTWLSGITLLDGESYSTIISGDYFDSQGRADLQLSGSNLIFTKLNQAITNEGTIIFILGDIDPVSPRPITIQNNTGETILYGYVRYAGALSWASLFTNTTLPHGQSQSAIIYNYLLDSQGRVDLQLRTAESGGVIFTKTYQTITANTVIIFTSDDIDT